MMVCQFVAPSMQSHFTQKPFGQSIYVARDRCFEKPETFSIGRYVRHHFFDRQSISPVQVNMATIIVLQDRRHEQLSNGNMAEPIAMAWIRETQILICSTENREMHFQLRIDISVQRIDHQILSIVLRCKEIALTCLIQFFRNPSQLKQRHWKNVVELPQKFSKMHKIFS